LRYLCMYVCNFFSNCVPKYKNGCQSKRHCNIILQCLAPGIIAKCQIWPSLHPYQWDVRYGNFWQQKKERNNSKQITNLGRFAPTKMLCWTLKQTSFSEANATTAGFTTTTLALKFRSSVLTWRPMEHAGRVVLHLRLLEVKVLRLESILWNRFGRNVRIKYILVWFKFLLWL
jgi:hypothetical protein